MTKDEALKLVQEALAALDNISTALRKDDVLGSNIELMLNTITAIYKALAQPVQEPVARVIDNGTPEGATEWIPFANRVEPLKTGDLLYTHAEERNFCPRCGKRVNLTTIHTCTPPRENT